jgi:cytochrome P450/NADPH-cytochrome P450 reductase
VRERQDEVWKLLEAGALVYVCGDATRMAPDVRRAFTAMHRARTGSTEAQAEAWVDGLAAGNRYLVDVWASG